MLMIAEAPRVTRTEDNFIRTFTGRKFWPLNSRVEDIDVRDIAHALSLQCRWTGHTYCHYSIADHSVRVSKLCEKRALESPFENRPLRIQFARDMALWGLLHDASEAYLCDLPTPLKRVPALGDPYRVFERRLMECIAARFDLGPYLPALVKGADNVLLNTEARDLMGVPCGDVEEWRVPGSRLEETIYPMTPEHAEAEFLRRFEALTMATRLERLGESLCADALGATQ